MTTTIKGKEIYSQIKDADNGQKLFTKETEKSPSRQYHRLAFNGIVFTVTPEVKAAWDNAEIAEMTVVEGTRTVEDPATGAPVEAKSLQYGGHITYKQAKGLARNEAELALMDKLVAQELKLSPEAVADAIA